MKRKREKNIYKHTHTHWTFGAIVWAGTFVVGTYLFFSFSSFEFSLLYCYITMLICFENVWHWKKVHTTFRWNFYFGLKAHFIMGSLNIDFFSINAVAFLSWRCHTPNSFILFNQFDKHLNWIGLFFFSFSFRSWWCLLLLLLLLLFILNPLCHLLRCIHWLFKNERTFQHTRHPYAHIYLHMCIFSKGAS